MINRVAPLTQIETLTTGNILASTYFDANISPVFSAVNDSSLGQVNGVCTDTGSANVYQIVPANMPYGPPSALNPGFCVFFTPANTNTGNSTLTVGSLASAPILNRAGIPLQGGEINANKTLGVVYSNVSPAGFRITSPTFLCVNYFNPGNISVECAGYDGVSVLVIMTSATTALGLNHVGYGVPVHVTFVNQASSAKSYLLTLLDVSGRGVTCTVSFPTSTSGALSFQISQGTSTPPSLAAGSFITFRGAIDQPVYTGGSVAHFIA